jgi:hypothetical protein
MRIGSHAPIWRVPCLRNSRVQDLSLTAFQGTPLVVCCLSSLAEHDAWLLETQCPRFLDSEVILASLVSDDLGFGQSWTRLPQDFCLPILTDSLRQLWHSLHLSPSLPPQRCETLFFNRHSRLQFRLIHDLNLRGLGAVLELADSEVCRRSDQPSADAPLTLNCFDLPHSGKETPTSAQP